jgi:oxalate decarboxylase/phosphoglucose isomerase-like protein (cupin superfamily)
VEAQIALVRCAADECITSVPFVLYVHRDVGYVQNTLLHYVENTGDTDVVFLEIFKADRFQDLSFSNGWRIRHRN